MPEAVIIPSSEMRRLWLREIKGSIQRAEFQRQRRTHVCLTTRNFQMPTGPVRSSPTSRLPYLPRLMPLHPDSSLPHPEVISGANTQPRSPSDNWVPPVAIHKGMMFLSIKLTNFPFWVVITLCYCGHNCVLVRSWPVRCNTLSPHALGPPTLSSLLTTAL